MQTSAVWSIIFKPNGVINTLLGRFDIKGPNWLGSGNLAFLCVCIVAVWKNIGYFLVIYYTGVQGVPYTEYLLYRKEGSDIALQNISGMGNITFLPSQRRAAGPPAGTFDRGRRELQPYSYSVLGYRLGQCVPGAKVFSLACISHYLDAGFLLHNGIVKADFR